MDRNRLKRQVYKTETNETQVKNIRVSGKKPPDRIPAEKNTLMMMMTPKKNDNKEDTTQDKIP